MALQQLKHVIEIVNSSSVNEAAEKPYITRSNLSGAVEELESEVGTEFFLRTPKRITLTPNGAEFLGYARQVVEQASLPKQQYLNKEPSYRLYLVSTQHYAFAVNAFINVIQKGGADEYEFTPRGARTYEIIEDVKTLRSELGILYRNPFNRKVIDKLLKENHLEFHPLFTAEPHTFISSGNPSAERKFVTLEDLEEYPYLSFEQGDYSSFYFSEKILSTVFHKGSIHVSDRVTIFNLIVGLDGYTVSTGIVSTDLNGDSVASVPLVVNDKTQVDWISNRQIQLSRQALSYVEELHDVIGGCGLTLEE